ncbi:MAG: CBS domain-containing protein, partial [Planctomycetes bacterium]|nr:CBS domain-containing protein [Planctomycetota bacterium]
MWESSLARDVMVTRLITVRPEDQVLDCIDLLLQNGISGAPIVDGDQYVGTFSEKSCWRTLIELYEALAESDSSRLQLVSAKDIMRAKLLTFSPGADTLKATDQLVDRRVSGGPVVDSDG